MTKQTITAAAALIIGALIGYTFTPTQNLTKLSIDTSNGTVTQNGNSWDIAVSSNGYARVNYKIPEQDSKYLTSFDMTVNFTLPPTFYSDMKNGFRIINTDNFPATLNGAKVGAKDANEWRCGIYFFASDGLMRAKCEHETKGAILLWTAKSKLATGSHTVRFIGDMAQLAEWRVDVDGATVASGKQRLCLPAEMTESECVITRVRAGIDGGGAGVRLTLNSFSVAELGDLPIITPSAVVISTNTPIPATARNVPSLTPTASRTPVPTVNPCTVVEDAAYRVTICGK